MREPRHRFLFLSLSLVLTVGLVFFVLSAENSQLKVCKVGCNFSSINAATEYVSPGDVVFVSAGTYRENISINKDLTLEGSKEGDTLIKPKEEGHPLISVGPSDVEVTIKSITLSGSRGSPSNKEKNVFPDGISITGVANLDLINVIILNNKKCGVRLLEESKVNVLESSIARNGVAACLGNKSELRLEESSISSNSLVLSGSATVNMVKTSVSNHDQVGLELKDTTMAKITGGKIGTCETCILLTDNAYLNLKGSTVSDAGDGVRLGGSSSTEISGSEFTGCTSGIELRDYSQAKVISTKIRNNDHGVSLFNSADLRIQNCRIAFNDLGIRAEPNSQVRIRGCDIMFYNNFEKNIVGVQRKVEEDLQDRCK
ncbi:right-handed parallel beta-helix repeat-containing protein [Candidatus Bipolaricaulota bacterium]|nr:right-handed parallel beta-helix repeat-containing protein [Candidatus Bipolaricaulota bacterium]